MISHCWFILLVLLITGSKKAQSYKVSVNAAAHLKTSAPLEANRVSVNAAAHLTTSAPLEANILNLNVDSVSRPGYPLTLELEPEAEHIFDAYLQQRGGIEMLAEIPAKFRIAGSSSKYPNRYQTLTKICASTFKQFRLGLVALYSIGFTGYINKMEERQAWFTDMRSWSAEQFENAFPKLARGGARLLVEGRQKGCWLVVGAPPKGLAYKEDVEGADIKVQDAQTLTENGFSGFGPVTSDQYWKLLNGLAFEDIDGTVICNHFVAVSELLQSDKQCMVSRKTPAAEDKLPLLAAAEVHHDPVSWFSQHIVKTDLEQKACELFRIMAFGEQPFSPLAQFGVLPDIVALEELDFLDIGVAPFDTSDPLYASSHATPRSSSSSPRVTLRHALEIVGFDATSFERPVPADEVAILWRNRRFRFALDGDGEPVPPLTINIDEGNDNLKDSQKKVAGIVALQANAGNSTDKRVLLVVAAHLMPGDGAKERHAQRSELAQIHNAITTLTKSSLAHLDPYIVFLGDFNVDSLHFHEVTEMEPGTWHGLIDAHKVWYDKDPNGKDSYGKRVNPYSPERRATQYDGVGGKRVDYIFVDSRAEVLFASSPNPDVSHVKLPIQGKHPSDHVAVSVTMQIL